MSRVNLGRVTTPGDDPRLLAQRRLEAMVGRGELSLAEFGEHAAAIWSATCPAELDVVMASLPDRADPRHRPFDEPAGAGDPVPAPSPGPRPAVTYAGDGDRPVRVILGDRLTREGRWDLTRGFRCEAWLTDVFLDLREAVVDAPRTRVEVKAYGGDVGVLLPPGVTVTLGGSQFLADVRVDDTEFIGGGGPHIDLDATCVLGGVKVRYLPPGQPVPKLWKWF